MASKYALWLLKHLGASDANRLFDFGQKLAEIPPVMDNPANLNYVAFYTEDDGSPAQLGEAVLCALFGSGGPAIKGAVLRLKPVQFAPSLRLAILGGEGKPK